MKKNPRFERPIVLAFLILMAISLGGCNPFTRLKTSETRSDVEYSWKGAGTEAARGLANVGFGWLEIPNRAEYRVRRNLDAREEFSLISALYDGSWGVLDGAGRTVQRAGVGVFELVMSPFPPYDPYVEPPHPFAIYPVEYEEFIDE